MINRFCILLLLFLICLLAASCTSGEIQQLPDTPPAPQIISGKIEPSESVPDIENADVDLSALSSIMVYAEVYNMMINPEDYMGKTIKICGPYYSSYYDATEQNYHYVIIEDATACCVQGMEFIWMGDHTYPDDYPDKQTKIEITGVFGSYDELGFTYYYLAVDNITILKD